MRSLFGQVIVGESLLFLRTESNKHFSNIINSGFAFKELVFCDVFQI